MTAPRQVLPGATYLVTRRCSERRFLLRPSPAVNGIFLFVLAVAAKRFGVHVHAVCVLSNHVHLVVTDTAARLPAFAQYVFSLVARATNGSLGRWESFWAPGSYSAVKLESPDDVVAKTAYALANPVAAALVRRGDEWPGLRTAVAQLGAATLTAPRPDAFFRNEGYLPMKEDLELPVPPGFATAEEFRQRVSAALEALEANHVKAITRGGFLGVEKVLAQKPWTRPDRREARRKLNPRIAARDQWKRLEALSRLKEFLNSYRAAWAALRSGAREVLFPAGTYLLRVVHGVKCASTA
jgi:REP element-mobilizing transposase RayT